MVYFLVEAQPKGYSVRRSAQDFVWLREVLKKFYPGIFIPPINNKELFSMYRIGKSKERDIYFFRI